MANRMLYVILLCCINIVILTWWNNSPPLSQSNVRMSGSTHISDGLPAELQRNECYKKVYTWIASPYYQHVFFKKGGKFQCPGLECGINIAYGKNYSELETSDIVILYFREKWDWDEVMKHRSLSQKYIFYAHESPRNTGRWLVPPPQYNNISYDYFMSFRRELLDENIVIRGAEYGRYDSTSPSIDTDDNRNWAENKSRILVWVASHCQGRTLSWKRTEFVIALSRHISTDLYGKCGEGRIGNFAKRNLSDYKFYLALENSECRDYITEKFWYNSLSSGLVPVVHGPPKQDYVDVSPPNSFIYVKDFTSTSALADYLLKLHHNDSLYNAYFQWKKSGSVKYTKLFSQLRRESLCNNVVAKVLDDEEHNDSAAANGRRPNMPDWETWWTGSCKDSVGFPILVD